MAKKQPQKKKPSGATTALTIAGLAALGLLMRGKRKKNASAEYRRDLYA